MAEQPRRRQEAGPIEIQPDAISRIDVDAHARTGGGIIAAQDIRVGGEKPASVPPNDKTAVMDRNTAFMIHGSLLEANPT